MSSEVLNDENQGTLPVHKHVLSESAADIFALDHPTGRPSILRPSQADNINKNLIKGVKVCFQTPLRDPVTKRIMSPSRMDKMSTLDDCTTALESLTLKSASPPNDSTKTHASFPDDDMPIQSRGGYAIDYDNLDSINPFQSSDKMLLSPAVPAVLSDTVCLNEEVEPLLSVKPDLALDETLPFNPSVENSLGDSSADGTSTDSTVIIEPKETSLPVHIADETVNIEDPESAPAPSLDLTDQTVLPKGSYQVDFNDLDPFKSSSSISHDSPPVCTSAPPKAPEMSSAVKDDERGLGLDKSGLTEVNTVTDVADTTASAPAPPKDTPLVMEFNFDDGAGVKRKPPPKRLGLKKPPLSKGKPASALAQRKSPETKLESCDHTEMEVPLAKGSYSIDFDQFDDPDFNPFGTKAKMGSSPPRGSPVMEHTEGSSRSSPSADNEEAADTEPHGTKISEEPECSVVAEMDTPQPCLPDIPNTPLTEESALSCPPVHGTEFNSTAADDEFVPGSMFMPSDVDGEIDYLEQFGSSTFKESALRKQSLYLKFDPLLKESPKKATVESVSSSGFSLPRPSLAIRMMEAARSEVRQKSQQECSKLLVDLPPMAEFPLVQDPTVLDLLVPTLKQTHRSEDVIVDMLMYTQKDLDSALEKAQKQAEEREQELKAQIEKLTLDNQHMVLIVSEFETVVAEITAEHKQKDELAQAELSKVLQEKQQLAKELSDMERSFSDVVKRLDRRKEIIDGFKKNEETLKQCAQTYLTRLQKEEQRYQMLKTHAEEKIEQANKQIAEVRSKLGVEVSALQVQLRREQLKVQSLEKNLEQKTREVEDVTKLCDELIAKVQQR